MATSNSIITLRRHDLDNLRTFLTGLVTVHHTALAYGGEGGWIFKSAAFKESRSPLLIGFTMFNQSFFMGLFFWISGRVSAQSLERTANPCKFIKNKIWRLGLPTLLYTLLANPFIFRMGTSHWSDKPFRQYLKDYFLTLRGARGPLWYTATLLSFDIVTALGRELFHSTKDDPQRAPQTKRYEKLKKYGWIAVVACGFLAKIHYPLGTFLPILNVQPAYFFQYVYAYSLGYLSYHVNERTMKGPFDQSRAPTKLETSKENVETHAAGTSSTTYLTTTSAISILSIGFVFVPFYRNSADWFDKTVEQAFGGWNLPSLLYAVWNEVSFNLVGPALMAYFEQWQYRPAKTTLWDERYSYASFLVHTPVSVAIEGLVERILVSDALQTACRDNLIWQVLGPVFVTGIVGLASAWASSTAGRLLLQWYLSLKGRVACSHHQRKER